MFLLMSFLCICSTVIYPANAFAYEHMRSIKKVYISTETVNVVLPSVRYFVSGKDDATAELANIDGAFDFSYNLINPESYAAFLIDADKWLKRNLSWNQINAFSFKIRSAFAKLPLKISFQNVDGEGVLLDAYSVYMSDYQKAILDDWTEISIPVEAIVGLPLSDIDQVVFVCEYDYAKANDSALDGEFLISDVGFNTNVSDSVLVDSFSDNYGYNSLGGNIGNLNDHTATFTKSEAHDFQGALESAYKFETETWCGLYMILGGGDGNNAGWTAEPCDFSRFNKLTFWAKAASKLENPKKFKIEIVDSNKKASVYCDGLTDQWAKYSIDLNQIDDLNKATIKQLNVIYEMFQVFISEGSKRGRVYFDDFRFEV